MANRLARRSVERAYTPHDGGGHGLDSDSTPAPWAQAGDRAATTTLPAAPPVSPRRHLAWLAGGMVGAFLIPFILADQLAVQRDLYYAAYVAAVVGLFVAWSRDTHQPLRATLARRWRLAVSLGIG